MAKTGILAAMIIGASALSPAVSAPKPPSFSKPGPDAAPLAPPPSLEEVFVTSKTPRKKNETATVKEAFARVKNGGVIFITEMSSDISNDDTVLLIDRPVTIALDPDLKTQMDIDGDGNTARAKLNAAADGACLVIGQYELGDDAGRRTPRNEVTIRGIEFVPNPASKPGACVTVNDGRVFFDNVEISADGLSKKAFQQGVVIRGGELITNERVRISAAKTGLDVRGGAAELAEGATITAAGERNAAKLETSCRQAVQDSSVGVFVGRSSDNRVGDPVVILRRAQITGFDYGVCSAGTGVSIEGSSIRGNHIGVRAERRIRIASAGLFNADVAALIVGSSDAEVTNSSLYNSAIGVFLDTPELPTFRSNRFHFNGEAIRYDWEIRNDRNFLDKLFSRRSEEEKRLVASFTDNVVSCNKKAGVFEKYRLFKKAHRNECFDNTPGNCDGTKASKECAEARADLSLAPNVCAAGT
ncbi:MAG: hypothetical protein U5J99_04230 [Parvularculaceae bacterium]|nr:hypothetical protein [Parvularculaceae bacterium]